MYSTSFTQPPTQDQALNNSHLAWYPPHVALAFQPSTISPQQNQQIAYQTVQEAQYHAQGHHQIHQIPSYTQQQHSHSPALPYSEYGSPQAAYQYQQHQQQHQQHQFGIQEQQQQQQQHHHQQQQPQQQQSPFDSAPQFWQQHSQPQQIYTSQNVQSGILSGHGAGLPWSPVGYNNKDLMTDPKVLNLHPHPVAVSPSQLQYDLRPMAIQINGTTTSCGDNDSIEGTDDDDHDIRKQLYDTNCLSPSTPPLSPQSIDYNIQGGLGRFHGQTSSQSLAESLAGLSTSSPTTSFIPSPVPSFNSGPHYANDLGNGGHTFGDAANVPGSVRKIKTEEEVDENKKRTSIKKIKEEGNDSELRPFQCEFCQKDFRRQYNLNAHLKTHLEERIHACNECPKTFLRPYDLSRHQRIHTLDKPYKCRICSQIFIRNDAIWRHYRKAHKGHPEVPTSRRDKKKHIGSSNVGALVTRVVSAAASNSRAKSASRKAKSKAMMAATLSTKLTDNTQI